MRALDYRLFSREDCHQVLSGRPSPCDRPAARFARTALRELWLVTAVLRQMTSDWARGPSNDSSLVTIACKRPGRRVGSRAQLLSR